MRQCVPCMQDYEKAQYKCPWVSGMDIATLGFTCAPVAQRGGIRQAGSLSFKACPRAWARALKPLLRTAGQAADDGPEGDHVRDGEQEAAGDRDVARQEGHRPAGPGGDAQLPGHRRQGPLPEGACSFFSFFVSPRRHSSCLWMLREGCLVGRWGQGEDAQLPGHHVQAALLITCALWISGYLFSVHNGMPIADVHG